MMSSSQRRTSTTTTRTTTPIQELKAPPAPASFKHTIDLPPESDDEYFDDYDRGGVSPSPVGLDFNADDDDIEMQRYLEQIYMSSTRKHEPKHEPTRSSRTTEATSDFGISGLGLIDTKPNSHETQNLKHKLKGDEGRKEKHRKQGPSHRFEVGSSRDSGSASKHATVASSRDDRYWSRHSSHHQDTSGPSHPEWRGEPGDLDELDIALVRPEEQWSGGAVVDDFWMAGKPDGKEKGKGKVRDLRW
ncbi:hypothetical protein FB446DRAFT_424668 [Lentinula raphanica]|nr:hypothetical protein FB446DRAFT_424668 [Lentinula raphanica]